MSSPAHRCWSPTSAKATSRIALSGSSGDVVFNDPEAGQYTVTISRDGLKKWTAIDVTLTARQQLRIDAVLTAGSEQQELQVSADAISSIDTDDARVSGTYNAADVLHLPVNRRASASGISALHLVGTLHGVHDDHFPSSEEIAEIRTDGVLNNAEFGQPGEITMVTHGGTNTIHASLF